ncbi:hypothetical protein Z042_03650 [Chania multitudinisentens RB-25]|uniref:Flagella biosynthesis regulator n=1 Tax=Chania multitudinisentens RB-25 TaxID=1441930 RepID=W0LJM7_9GAMM|nr:hypothetical protein Z042_03650 [Chania multitudinisentens RB-25]
MLATLKQSADPQEQQQISDYCQLRFNSGLNTPLTPVQMNDVIQQLFSRRLAKGEHAAPPHSENPQPLFHPLIAMLPPSLQSTISKPLVLIALVLVLLVLFVWVF